MSPTRGGGNVHGAVKDWDKVHSPEPEATVLALHDANGQMMTFDARKARVVEKSYFGRMSVQAIAAVTGISARTVRRDLRPAEAGLRRSLSEQGVVLAAWPAAREQSLP